jgi:hypothetical protein
MGKEIGTHYAFYHGGVSPDYAIAAEGCDFGLTWVASGYAVFRIQLFGEGVFTPLLESPERASDHPNPIYRLGDTIQSVLDWGRAYEQENIYTSSGGVSKPKTQISSVRGGVPYAFGAGTEICSLYLEVGLPPHVEIGQVHRSLESHLRQQGIGEFSLEPVVVRHGFAADENRVAPLVSAVDAATRDTLGEPLKLAHPVYSSMWRDHNVFNMNRIPAVTTGFPRWRPTPEDMVKSTLIYALTALSLCGRAPATENKKPLSGSDVYGQNPFSSAGVS